MKIYEKFIFQFFILSELFNFTLFRADHTSLAQPVSVLIPLSNIFLLICHPLFNSCRFYSKLTHENVLRVLAFKR